MTVASLQALLSITTLQQRRQKRMNKIKQIRRRRNQLHSEVKLKQRGLNHELMNQNHLCFSLQILLQEVNKTKKIGRREEMIEKTQNQNLDQNSKSVPFVKKRKKAH